MPKKSKKSYSAKLKFQVVLEALTSDKGDAEIARLRCASRESVKMEASVLELPRFGGVLRAWFSSL